MSAEKLSIVSTVTVTGATWTDIAMMTRLGHSEKYPTMADMKITGHSFASLPPDDDQSEVPLGIALTESAAVVSFGFNEGRFDYAGFYGTDEMFLNWVRDLFLHYWNQGT